ncbi:MAG TPA: phosphatase PAP2 family protein [Candidatus Binataceae bacterium]|nr:phosphatase PAP2 family protein [Candidatus Binataceae bacterium]
MNSRKSVSAALTWLPVLLWIAWGAFAGGASADEHCLRSDSDHRAYYGDPAKIELSRILAPPPRSDSAAGRADLDGVLDVQRNLTPTEIQDARTDTCISVFRFADVMGTGFNYQSLPFAREFFARIFQDEDHELQIAKDYFKRRRPFVADRRVKLLVDQRPNFAYPSGHATFAYAVSIVLANMVPEKAQAIFERAASYSRNRIVAGVHYPADIEAGRISASVIDNQFFQDRKFESDYARARIEVRHALGMN